MDEAQRQPEKAASGTDAPEDAELSKLAGELPESVIREEVNAALIEVLPWGISLVFHAAIVVLAVFAVYSTIAVAGRERVIIPSVRLADTPGSPLEMTQTKAPDHRRQTRRTIQSTQQQRENPLGQKVEINTALIGASGLTGAKAAPFNTTVDVSAQFRTHFFGVGGNAKKIVFVVDATGGLIDTLPHVIKELRKTINALSDRQSYTIIFFSGIKGREVVEVLPRGLKQADPRNKAQTLEWIDTPGNIELGHRSNPVRALREALGYRPDLIFLLSDAITGQGQSMVQQDDLLNQIKRLNTSNTKINTIQFIYRDPIEEWGGTSTMKLIASQTGGVYQFVSADDLYLK